ncbi:MAG TPA: serine/threonine-protein kinase [Myxococcaceae bacterium]|jgi:serine/threonine-protein kinase
MASRVVHPSCLVAGEWVGPWLVVKKLGSGAFGAVYKVECEGDFFALKLALRRPESGDANHTDARLQKELACLVRIHHPNVVRIHAFGGWPHPTKGYHYLLMDYVEGLTMQRWTEQRVPTIRMALHVFDRLALALDSVHREGVVHRDLKATNILVREQDDEPVLVDFGSGDHAGAPRITTDSLSPGTPHYRSPEAIRFWRENFHTHGVRYMFRETDEIYSLGVALYEVLTGRPPFSPLLPWEVLNLHIEGRVPLPPRSFDERIPPAVSALVMRMLAKRPEDRPQSGQQVHEEIQAVMDTEGSALEGRVLVRTPDLITTENGL